MLLKLILFSGFSGMAIIIGGLLANYFNHHIKESPVKQEITHTLMSFGAGIILSALALVLIPKGMAVLTIYGVIGSFGLGAVTFMLLDRQLAKSGSQQATLLAMMMDFVPESIALGAVFSIEPKTALLLALFIGLQNLPESFNAFRDLVLNGCSVRKTLVIFFFLSFFGIISALIGHFLLSEYPNLTAHLMIFASGGILYLLIQDIIPESKLDNNYLTSLGATFGFLMGVIGKMLL